ncbi:MAG: alpha/beta hydrolase [Desulfobacteraceae bacterium]|nr:alpha/beta hydrolase [Desulfobacterales bacterium]MBL6966931.1 alpha/beta hydrolase [Desulfobacteraceae bacterium]MBL7101317.1 alpha/beta hydrolase [Desulfobacteraceae bacterium]MBL7171254.1 alpha/beta hydrolase [Desulfobacteraceae bacterium]
MMMQTLRDRGIGFKAGSDSVLEDRPILVMIHGAGGDSQVWQNQTHLLKGSLNTLAVDLPGHGASVDGAKSDLDEYAKWLIESLEAIFYEPIFLMGHSMGGAIVQKAALLAPHLMKGIILVGTGPRLQVAPMFLEGLQQDFESMVDNIIGFAYASGTDALLIKEGANLMKKAGQDMVYGDFSACNRFDVRSEVGKISLPCLIICGDEDKLTPPALSKKLNESIKGSRMEILPDAGHMVMIENYKAFNDCVLGFILKTGA